METLAKLFGTCFRCLRFYCCHDAVSWTEPEVVSAPIVPNTFGTVISKLPELEPNGHYSVELARARVFGRRDLEFYSLSNLVQYFASIGGFDATLALLSLGKDSEKGTKIPFSMLNYLLKPFKNLNRTLTPEFASQFSQKV